MTLEEIGEYAESLGCRRRASDGRTEWHVGGRLVVREDLEGVLCVRVDFDVRDRLASEHPDTFGIPPRWEKHQKMQALLDGDAGAIREAVRLAWELQHG